MDGDHVRLLEQLVEARVEQPVVGGLVAADDVVAEDVHPKAHGARGDGHPDRAHADDADGLAVEAPAGDLVPHTGLELRDGLGDHARQVQDEGEGEVRGLLPVCAGRVGDRDAAAHGLGKVDAVEARAVAGDELEVGQPVDGGASRWSLPRTMASQSWA